MSITSRCEMLPFETIVPSDVYEDKAFQDGMSTFCSPDTL
jgi:hypothetical protein